MRCAEKTTVLRFVSNSFLIEGNMMTDRKEDRRVTYTKTALRNALVNLMQDQHISGITVKSICELADVNRSTFYLHYRDPYDLLQHMEQEVLETLGARLNTQQDTEDKGPMSLMALTEVLEYAQENAKLARVLLSENCDFVLQRHITELVQAITAWMGPIHDERLKDYIINYSINGCIAIAEKWLRDGMIEQPEKIAQLIFQVLYYGTAGFVTTDDAAGS
jgi:AcrR family transcriptional regulator